MTQNIGVTGGFPHPPESIPVFLVAAVASANSVDDDEDCNPSLLDDLVHEEAQSADITPKLKDTILVLIYAVYYLQVDLAAHHLGLIHTYVGCSLHIADVNYIHRKPC